jgi:hypothetical protein
LQLLNCVVLKFFYNLLREIAIKERKIWLAKWKISKKLDGTVGLSLQ